MDITPYKPLAEHTRALFKAYILEGFTEDQALELVKSQYSFALVNYQIEDQRRKKRTARAQEILRRYAENNEGEQK